MNILELFAKALPKPTFLVTDPRVSKHQASKPGHKHMSKRMPSNHHSSVVLPSQHERVVAGRAARLGIPLERYKELCQIGKEINRERK